MQGKELPSTAQYIKSTLETILTCAINHKFTQKGLGCREHRGLPGERRVFESQIISMCVYRKEHEAFKKKNSIKHGGGTQYLRVVFSASGTD